MDTECEAPFSPSTAKVIEANAAGPVNPSGGPPAEKSLFQRPCSSGDEATAAFRWAPHEKQRVDFTGSRKGPSEGLSSRAQAKALKLRPPGTGQRLLVKPHEAPLHEVKDEASSGQDEAEEFDVVEARDRSSSLIVVEDQKPHQNQEAPSAENVVSASATTLSNRAPSPRLHDGSPKPFGGPPKLKAGIRRPSRPTGMPVAGALDIMDMLKMKLHQDEQQASLSLERSKNESLQRIRDLEHAQAVGQNKLEVLESEKERLLAKTRHDQEQLSSLRKRSATLENFVHGFSSDFNRLREDIVRAQNTCSQLMEDKGRQDSERAKLVEQFNANLLKSESLHLEAKSSITALQARLDTMTKEKEMLESDLNEKVGMLAEQRDTCSKLQRHLEEIRQIPQEVSESMHTNSQATMQILEGLRVSVQHHNVDEKTMTMLIECAEYLNRMRDSDDASLPGTKKIHEAVENLALSLSTRLDELETVARVRPTHASAQQDVSSSLKELQARNDSLTAQLEKVKEEANEMAARQVEELEAQAMEAQKKIEALESERKETERQALSDLDAVRINLREEADKLRQEQKAKYENALLQANKKRFQLENQLRDSVEERVSSEAQMHSLMEQAREKDDEIRQMKEIRAESGKVGHLQQSSAKASSEGQGFIGLGIPTEVLPTFGSLIEKPQQSSSMLSDAVPSTPEHLQGHSQAQEAPGDTIRSDGLPSQDESGQRSLARPNTGSKLARYCTPTNNLKRRAALAFDENSEGSVKKQTQDVQVDEPVPRSQDKKHHFKNSDHQYQAPPSPNIRSAPRSRIRSSGGDSQSTSSRTNRRQKDKARYDLRFSQELRDR